MKREKSCGAVVYRIEDGEIQYLVEHMSKGHYSIPKGHVEAGETEVQTARREIMEETNLEVEIDDSFRRVISYSPYQGCMKDVVFFVARAVSDDMVNQESEVSGLEWMSLDDAVKRLTHATDKKTIIEADRHIKGE